MGATTSRLVGSIWNLDRSLADSLDQLRQDARATAVFASAQDGYRACANARGLGNIDHPQDLEALDLTSASTLTAVKAVEQDCTRFWNTANERGMAQAAVQFRAVNAVALEAQQSKYAGSVERIILDQNFLDFLAVAAARIRFEAQQ